MPTSLPSWPVCERPSPPDTPGTVTNNQRAVGDPDPKLSTKKMEMGFLEAARRRKASVAMYSVETKRDHFQRSKSFSAPLAPEVILTSSWSCQLSPFPKPPV